MSNASFLELEVLQAVNNGQLPEAERLIKEMSRAERRLFSKLLQDTLDLIGLGARADCKHSNTATFRASSSVNYSKCLDCGQNLGQA